MDLKGTGVVSERARGSGTGWRNGKVDTEARWKMENWKDVHWNEITMIAVEREND